ncbi:hypothetical protein HCTV-16_gp166 [Haloarcula virus HCTV-16]|nr:hypothetical protein HCTV-16_gp166 [Haloarcula virus HCTV-16]
MRDENERVEFTYGGFPTMYGTLLWHWKERPWQSVVSPRVERFWDKRLNDGPE